MRLIVRRVKPTHGSQLALFASYSYHGFITDRDGETLELEADHRRHAEIENAIRDLKQGAWIVLDAARIPGLMVTAIRTSFEGRRGPTHLTIPTDIQSQHVDEDAIRYYEAASTRHSRPIAGVA